MSRPAAGGAPPLRSAEEGEALAARLVAARVGGSFWAPPPPPDRRALIVPPADATAATIEALTRRAAAPALILLPAGARRLRRRLEARGLAAWCGPIDPWPLLHPGGIVLAPAAHELAALACLAGATLDTLDGPAPTRAAVIARLQAEARYRDPFSGAETGPDAAIALLALWRREIDANRTIVAAAGMAWWKRAEIRRFLWAPRGAPLRFHRTGSHAIAVAARRHGAVAIWPSRVSPALIATAAAQAVPLVRVEDGFVRSVGLGSNLFPPYSVVVDRRGIHFDPAGPSDLEHLLQNHRFDADLLARAEALRAFLVAAGIGKYGADTGSEALPPRAAPGRRLVLVPGQVEDDMSVRAGGGAVAGNLDLLRRARAAEPDAELWFRPHPDVDAGHRVGHVADAEALRYADRVVRGGGMAPLLAAVDGVHVLTSLTGFEALLRGRDVTTHGSPFYAGWGLTRDLGPALPRRTRRLSLADLIAGVLLLYPRYLDPVTRLPCPAEVLAHRLLDPTLGRPGLVTRLRMLQGRLTSRRGAASLLKR